MNQFHTSVAVTFYTTPDLCNPSLNSGRKLLKLREFTNTAGRYNDFSVLKVLSNGKTSKDVLFNRLQLQ